MNENTLASIRSDFVEYSFDVIEDLRKLAINDIVSDESQYSLLLGLHNLKGAAGSLGFEAFMRYCHNLEDLLTADVVFSKSIRSDVLRGLEELAEIITWELKDLLNKGESNVPLPHNTVKIQLSTLLYVSKRNQDVACAVDEILDVARRNNERLDITGALLFSGYNFVQVLEGDRTKLNDLYRGIEKDQRHKDVEICYVADIGERFFPNWRMAYFPDSAINRDKLKRLTDSDVFNPESYSSKMLLHMMRKLAHES
ncbi:BLUF domain-containing protein [Kiloniella majae]|uniref:BLUF domain-containing protein n=1 Tax=Kiloniella majae TaxID=1938558 RepID=UPI000A278531|nr:BLUF domain-containing protein [Kiloniella majae]